MYSVSARIIDQMDDREPTLSESMFAAVKELPRLPIEATIQTEERPDGLARGLVFGLGIAFGLYLFFAGVAGLIWLAGQAADFLGAK